MNLICEKQGEDFFWFANNYNASGCNRTCSDRVPNIPKTGYWGCCVLEGEIINHRYPCTECFEGPADPVNNCEMDPYTGSMVFIGEL